MSDIYDDPRVREGEDEYPDTVRFELLRDRVRGQVISVEIINTKYGDTLKYMLRTEKGVVSMLAGSKNLRGQMIELRPRPGDVVDIELVEFRQTAQGTAKIFDIHVERVPRSNEPQTVGASSPALNAPQPQAVADTWRPPSGNVPDDERDLFDR